MCMEIHCLVEVVKKEYDSAIEMTKIAESNQLYWAGRAEFAKELLDKLRPYRNNSTRSCVYCEITEEGCEKCFN